MYQVQQRIFSHFFSHSFEKHVKLPGISYSILSWAINVITISIKIAELVDNDLIGRSSRKISRVALQKGCLRIITQWLSLPVKVGELFV